MFTRHSLAAACAVLALSAGVSQASTFNFDFESGAGTPTGFANGMATSVGGMAGLNGFSGNFWWNSSGSGVGSATVLTGLDAHDTVTISFSLALIDSWDGFSGSAAPDYFNLAADSVNVLQMSVENVGGTDELIPAEATNRHTGNFVVSGWNDSLFDVTLTLSHSASSLALNFFADGAGWQGGLDESWGIDNLSVQTSLSTEVVPLPSGLPLLFTALGGLGLLGRRRRRG